VNLLSLLFVVVPGFIADKALRAWYGQRKTSDFELTVRSLIFSVLGLAVYLGLSAGVVALWPAAAASGVVRPAYLAAVGDASGKTAAVIDATAMGAVLLHTAIATTLALLWTWVITRKRVTNFLATHAGRSLRSNAWQLTWGEYARTEDPGGRWVTVVLTDGTRVRGQMQVASDPLDDKDLLLVHPFFWEPDPGRWRAENVRFVYLRESQIHSVLLAPAGDEQALLGYFDRNFAVLPADPAAGAAGGADSHQALQEG
jgi:hypothetical protein